MVVQHLHTVPGVSSNLTFTTNLSRRVRVDEGLISRIRSFEYFLRNQLYAWLVFNGLASLASTQKEGVRISYPAPSFVRVSASEVTLFSILRRYYTVEGKWVQLPGDRKIPAVWLLRWMNPK
jgi:hypothetical protein